MKKKIFYLLAALLPLSAMAASYTLRRVSVHDPSVVWEPESKTYYIFGSHRANAKTTDMMNWTEVSVPFATATSTNAAPSAAFATPQVTKVKKGGVEYDFNFNAFNWSKRGNSNYDISGNLWAPDVIWNPAMKKWCMYMSVNGDAWFSSIVLLTADKIEGPYRYQAPVVISGFKSGTTYKDTDLEIVLGEQASLPARYNVGNNWGRRYPNNIDPCVFYDEQGKLWMSYGSWSGGIWMLELDENTGLRDYNVTYELKGTGDGITVDPYFGKKIAGGYYVSGEASYIEYIGGYYYLFMSYGGLAAGGVASDYNNGGYQMRVFRSENPDGPYVDSKNSSAIFNSYQLNFGAKANDGNRGENIFGCYTDWGNQAKASMGERSQGHNSIIAAPDGRTYLVYHTRFQNWGEAHQVRVHQVFQNNAGWLVAAPFEYTGEEVKSADIATTQQIATDKIPGKYKLLIHTYKLDHTKKATNSPVNIELKSDGSITGDQTGTWNITANTSYIHLKIGTVHYYGVMVEQTLEPSDEKVPAFTVLCATTGVTAWGYRYDNGSDDPEPTVEGDINTGVIAYYNFDGSTISNSYDATQIASLLKNGNNIAPSTQSDANRNSNVIHTNFGAANNESYVRFDNPLYNQTLTEGATVAFWVNSAEQNLWDALFAFYDTQSPNGRVYMTGNTYIGYNSGSGNWIDLNHPEKYPTANITFGTWNFVTVTISRTEGFKVYVDGKLKDFIGVAGSLNGTGISSASTFDYNLIVDHIRKCNYFYFGFGSFWGSCNANYDELLIYNRVLTANDAKKLYQTEVSEGSFPTGISAVKMTPQLSDGTVYDLQGRKIDASQMQRGIYIKNGKKFVVR